MWIIGSFVFVYVQIILRLCFVLKLNKITKNEISLQLILYALLVGVANDCALQDLLSEW